MMYMIGMEWHGMHTMGDNLQPLELFLSLHEVLDKHTPHSMYIPANTRSRAVTWTELTKLDRPRTSGGPMGRTKATAIP
jgi:hypothetical protein